MGDAVKVMNRHNKGNNCGERTLNERNLRMKIEKVLMVDDDADIRKIAEFSLVRVGKWNTVTTESGAKALDLLKYYEPDVILLDVMMPEMDGPKTLKALRGAGICIPVIFMSAKVQTHEVDSYKELGAVGLIVKPFDPMLLPGQVVELLKSAAEVLA